MPRKALMIPKHRSKQTDETAQSNRSCQAGQATPEFSVLIAIALCKARFDASISSPKSHSIARARENS